VADGEERQELFHGFFGDRGLGVFVGRAVVCGRIVQRW
jgi:hypothetical protein